jgi:two-component system response regulator FixJ
MLDKNRLTVAVVDDDASALEMICSMLRKLGYQALAYDSAAALAAARRTQVFHALVLDLSMPDVDGFELIYLLAERQPVEPVIICSGLATDISQAARLVCESLGIKVLGILSKPFASDELGLFLLPHSRSLEDVRV